MLRFLQRIVSITCFLVLVFQITQVNGQNDSIKSSNDSYISFDLTTLLDSRAPRLRASYFKDINSHWKIGTAVGYGNRGLSFFAGNNNSDRIQDDYKLWEVRPEIIWIENPEDEDKRYLSLELFYVNHTDVLLQGEFRQDGLIVPYNSVDYQRQKYGLNIKYGFILDINDRLSFNLYSGLGFRIRNNVFKNADISDDFFSRNIFGGIKYREQGGSDFNYNFPLGLKLLYRL